MQAMPAGDLGIARSGAHGPQVCGGGRDAWDLKCPLGHVGLMWEGMLESGMVLGPVLKIVLLDTCPMPLP